MVECGLHEVIEGIAYWHIAEVRPTLRVYGPVHRKYDYLGELRPRGVVVWLECVVGVAGDCTLAVEVAHSLVEVVGGVHVGEANRAQCCRWRGCYAGGRSGGDKLRGCVHRCGCKGCACNGDGCLP